MTASVNSASESEDNGRVGDVSHSASVCCQQRGNPMTKTCQNMKPNGTLCPLAVDAKQLGELLSLSVRTVRSMDAAGKLPKPVKLNGRSVRWLPKEIEEWLQAGTPDRQTWEVLRKNGRHEG